MYNSNKFTILIGDLNGPNKKKDGKKQNAKSAKKNQ